MKEKGFYWLCQLLFWGIYTAFLLLVLAFGSGEPDQRLFWLQFIVGGTMLLVSHGLRAFIRRKNWVQRPLPWLLPRLLLLNLLFSAQAQLLIHGQMILFLDWLSFRPIVFKEVLIYTFNVNMLLCLWCLGYFSVQYFRRYRNSEIEKWKLQAALKEAELTALKAQINPHFIFNALNNIRALTREEGERARQMITSLSDLLRYAVDVSRQEEVSIAEEIAIVEDYLRLEAVHYEERLRYKIEVEPAALSLCLPPMSIQLLAENAIKHGISLLPGGGFLHVQVGLVQDQLFVEVENSGQIRTKDQNGIGLQIIGERLRLLYGDKGHFGIGNSSKEAVRARLQIPQKVLA